jgi:hypothetical protein
MAKKLKVWNGASWEDVTFAITPPSTNVTNSFTTNQVIDVSTSVSALRITQRGTGEALRVEDDTNPDSSPFVINASGNVGVGTSSPAVKLDISGNAVLSGQSTADQYIRIGHGRSGNGYSYIDLQGDSTYSNGLRIIRLNSGANSASNIEHRGSGSLNFITQESATISFTVNAAGGGAERFNINADGRNYMTSPLSVTGANWAEAMLHLTGTNASGVNPGLAWHAPGASAMSIFHVRGTQALQLRGNANVVDITSGVMSIRNIAISTSTPSGGNDGDVWLTYTA